MAVSSDSSVILALPNTVHHSALVLSALTSPKTQSSRPSPTWFLLKLLVISKTTRKWFLLVAKPIPEVVCVGVLAGRQDVTSFSLR